MKNIKSFNPHSELSNAYTEYFQLKEIAPDTYFRLIPTGEFELFDYDRGLCWIELRTQKEETRDKYGINHTSINISIGTVDDGGWSAKTVLNCNDVDKCMIRLRRQLDSLTALPKEDDLNILLSERIKPYIICGDFCC